MPNHVHILLGVGAVPLGRIMQAWKGASSRWINLELGRGGTLWGLVRQAGDWPGLWIDDRLTAWMDRTTAD